MAALPGSGGLSGLSYGNSGYRLPGNSPQLLVGGGYPNPGMGAMAYPAPMAPAEGYPNPGPMPQPQGTPQPAANDPVFQLDQIILTGNLKQRAVAAVRMLSLNTERGLDEIQKMMTAADPFQRENMASALGEQYHPLAVDLLKNALTDTERRVALVAYRALKRLERQPENSLPPEAREAIMDALKNAPAGLQDKK
jgi:hypothetical protein